MKTTMPKAIPQLARFAAMCLGTLLMFASARAVTWTVAILPSTGGDVVWSTTSPAKNGVLTKSGRITFDTGSFVHLTFQAEAGYQLSRVMKNTDDVTAWLDGNHHTSFGPVNKAHVIVAVFSVINPTGTVNLTAPTGNLNVTQIADLTGHYTGTSPTHYHRPYDVTVAMDEDGKLSAIGTINGITPKGGGPLMGSLGQIDTVKGQPTGRLAGKFSGVRDGVDGTCTATANAPVVVQDIGGGQPGLSGTISAAGKLAGVPYRDKNVPTLVPVTPQNQANLDEKWGLTMTIANKIDVRTHKPYVGANATLTEPNGTIIVFPERRLKYSITRGYSVVLSRGTNVTVNPTKLDKKASVVMRRMTLTMVGGVWKPNAGTVSYRFLGQKGTANVVDFVK